MCRVSTAQSSGSSPLARGLQGRVFDGECLQGIIPARAGFTHGRSMRMTPRPDHPRSRGVYAEYIVGDVWREGSSPLARGLLPFSKANTYNYRIIPARAGFTAPRPARTPQESDHPRSRGVYGSRSTGTPTRSGSSPLARGLHNSLTYATHHSRIIPARAGFTAAPPTGRTTRPDHPRSRGVYEAARSWAASRMGSSPLARGLHRAFHRRDHGRGIIPARAGFTVWRADQWHGREDHPRSRGVYTHHGT